MLISRLLVFLAVAWLVVGMLVVPPLLERAYHGEGFAPLRSLLTGGEGQSLAFLLAQWRGITIWGALACCALAGFAWLLLAPSAAQRLVGEATPGSVGAIRMLVCGILLVSTLWEDLPSTAALPREMIRPMGVMQLVRLIPGFEALAASPTALGVFQGLTALVLLLGLIGWKTRWVLPLGALLYLVLGGLLRQYAWFYHTGLIALYLLVVLSFLPAGDGWSADRLVRLWKGKPVPPSATPTRRYGWARYALWATLALPYVAAGLSKLRNGGLFWWEADNFRHILFYSTLRPMEFDFEVSLLLAGAPDVVFEALALSALLGELGYGLVLFSRWARRVFPPLMLGMHLGILFLQNILFFDLILLQLLFFNLAPLRERAARRLRVRRGRIRLFYDGASPRSMRLVRVLGALDLFERVRCTDRQAKASPLPPRLTGHAWVALRRGIAYQGAALYRLLARALPALWPLAPFLHVPGAPRLARHCLADQDTSRVRSSAEQDTSRLSTAPAKTRVGPRRRERIRSSSDDAPEHASARGGRGRRVVLALTTVLLACWVLRVEFYPFTGMQMFSKKRTSPVVYEVPLAHLRSGAVVRAPIEASIGAMSDSRYRRLLNMTFEPEQAALSEAFFSTVAARWNGAAPPAARIDSFEVQRWAWDFHTAPHNPGGTLVDRWMYAVPHAAAE